MLKSSIRTCLVAAIGSTALTGLIPTPAALAADTTLTIESWRTDDLPIWQEKIIPAFEKSHPGMKVVFQPTAPTEYNAALNSKLDAGTAGDIIACRPFDASLSLFQKGKLASVNDIPGVAGFSTPHCGLVRASRSRNCIAS